MDLYSDIIVSEEVKKLKEELTLEKAKVVRLENETAELQEKLKSLTTELNTLKNNMSALYLTAKLEMDRRDDEIKMLKKQ